MSVKVLSAFLDQSESTLGARLVGIVLSSSSWDDGITWLPLEDIAKRCRLSERQVYRCIRELEDLGELEKRKAQRGRRRVNVYRLRIGAAVPQYERLPFTLDDPFWSDDLTNRQVDADDLTSAPRRPDKSDADDLTNPASAPSIARKGNVKELATAPAARPRDLVWDELEEHFGVVASKTNAHAKRNKAVSDLKRLGATPTEIRSALKAYARLFPNTTCTDTALATHYPQLQARVSSVQARADSSPPEALPEISEEERAANLERLRELTGGVTRSAA